MGNYEKNEYKLKHKLEFDIKEIILGKNFFLGDSTYLISSSNKDDLPNHDINEIAFAGRSNVGKSSLINAITNRKKLARFSKTPGRTRQLNFFKVETKYHELVLVDLPGYGYAKVSRKEILKWGKLNNFYFLDRNNLRTVCLLLDCRREIYTHDLDMMDYLDNIGVSWTIILTKIDKVSKNFLIEKKIKILEKLKTKSASFPHIFAISSVKKEGLDELRAYIFSFKRKKIVL